MFKNCWCGNENMERYSKGYFKCAECFTLVSQTAFDKSIYNVKNEDSDYYGSNYWKKEMLEKAKVSSLDKLIELYFKDRAAHWLKYFLKYRLPHASVADIGGGLGQFSFFLRKAGFSQVMFEMSPEICEYSREHLQINTRHQDFTADLDEKFDSIAAFDLLEHILDAARFVRAMAVKTPADGLVCLQTPCYDETLSYEEMLEKKPKFEEQLMPEQHIYLFSRKAVTRLLGENGFGYIEFEPAVFGDDYDMFLFAGKKPLRTHSGSEIENALRGNSDMYLINALDDLKSEKDELELCVRDLWSDNESVRREADTRLKDVKFLDSKIKQTELQMKAVQVEADARLRDVDFLSDKLKQAEQAADNRLQELQHLNKRLGAAEHEKFALGRRLERKQYQQNELWTSLLRISGLLTVNAETMNVAEREAESRLKDVEILTATIKGMEREHSEEIIKLTDSLKIAQDNLVTVQNEAEKRLRDVEYLATVIQSAQRRAWREKKLAAGTWDALTASAEIAAEIADEKNAILQEYEMVKRQFWFRVMRKFRLIRYRK
jgi:2-polyprenyl-3-methyl-5-hydroxy-6-metoxy-1,4-benzoquinol methylase